MTEIHLGSSRRETVNEWAFFLWPATATFLLLHSQNDIALHGKAIYAIRTMAGLLVT